MPEHSNYCKTHSTRVFGWSIEIGLEWSMLPIFPPKEPEQFILPNFEDYIEDSCNSAEDFQPHMLKPEIDLYQIISGCLGEVG